MIMKYALTLLIALTAGLLLNAQQTIFENGKTDYVIVVPQRADSAELRAADFLQRGLRDCLNTEVPIVADSQCPNGQKAFLVGRTRLTDTTLLRVGELKDDGFLVKTLGNQVCFYALQPRGTIYGVAHFLERYLGVRMLTPDFVVAPHVDQLVLPEIDMLENPSFAYREVLYRYPNASQDYADFHCLHNRADLNRDWGMFVHTFQHLIPEKRYYDAHPEWFSEINGRRVRDGQLCLSNPEVLDTLCKNLKAMMDANPTATIWSVSNNDNYNVCTCPACRHLDSLYGGPSGTLIHFVNQVAERFPDKTISTLGYQFTRQAPTSPIKPRENVNVMFCSIECGREKPLAEDLSFRTDMENWAAKTDNIFMWDYVVQFRSMMNPFPNLQVLQPNLQFFKQHGVRMMFEQGTGAENKTSWMELRTYLLAKLMWDVDADVDSLTTDFCHGYYGPAADEMMRYYAEMHRALNESGLRLDIYGYPINGVKGYLSPTQIKKYQALIAEAYNKLGGKHPNDQRVQAYADHVRYLELSLDYAILELGMSNVSDELTFFVGPDRQVNQAMVDRAKAFVEDCQRFGIENLVEMGRTPEQFGSDIESYIWKCSVPNLARNASITLKNQPDDRYPAGGAEGLVDGVCGLLNYNYNWVGFYGTELDAVVDLKKVQEIHEVTMDCFFFPLSWIFAPDSVEVFVSRNGRRWEKVGAAKGTNPVQLARPDIHPYRVGNIGRKARYVRVVAHPLPEIPDWHRATGNPVWTFCDEIIIQ